MNTSFQTRRLGEIALNRGGSVDPSKFQGETFELFSIPSYDEGQSEIVKGCEIGSSKKIVQEGDILLSKIVPHIKRVWIVGKNRGYRQIASGEWIVYRSDQIHKEFLRFYLLSEGFRSQFMGTVKGIGGSLLRATPKLVDEIEFFEPPLETQKQIAAVLEKADQLRKDCQQMEQELKSLAQSVFIDMFGDPMANPMSYSLMELGDVCEFENGDRSSNYPSKSEVINKGELFLSSADIQGGRFVFRSSKFISKEKFNSLSRGKCSKGDVLMTLRGNGLGRTCVFDSVYERGFINAQMVILRPKEGVCSAEFLVSQLNCKIVFDNMLKLKSGSAQPQFSAGDIKKFKVLIPDIDLQNKYTEYVHQIKHLQDEHIDDSVEYDSLFESLMQKAFKGELDLAKAA